MKPERVIANYKQDGCGAYAVIIRVVGIENNLLLLSLGNSKEEAADNAIETLCMLKSNDMETVSIIEIIERDYTNE